MTHQHVSSIAIIGAGIAGLTCASALAESGFAVRIFEKSRGIGGRIATRRTANGLQFDHGAQYFTAQTPAFQVFVSEHLIAGNLAHWCPRGQPQLTRGDWLVGTPSMNAFLKPLGLKLKVELNRHVSDISPANGGWSLSFTGEETQETFDAVVVTAPAPQAQTLTTSSPLLQKRLDLVEMAPCWALMLAADTSGSAVASNMDAPHPDIAWMARDASKPGRAGPTETWVVHASTAYSRQHLEASPEAVTAHLQAIALPLAGLPESALAHSAVHRWRYARTLQPAATPFLSDESGTLLAAGDWCLGARVESAFESGRAAADFLASRLAR